MQKRLLLMRDLVDNQIVDREEERVTKVAGVEVHIPEGERPVVICLLIGPEPLARRIHPWIGMLVSALTPGNRTVRIPWERVVKAGPIVQVDMTARETGGTRAEDWVRDKIIRWIPGS